MYVLFITLHIRRRSLIRRCVSCDVCDGRAKVLQDKELLTELRDNQVIALEMVSGNCYTAVARPLHPLMRYLAKTIKLCYAYDMR